MPDFTIASAMPLIMSSLTLQPNLFHEFHPMGGVRARFAEGDAFSCANAAETTRTMSRRAAPRKGLIFMRLFYQNRTAVDRWRGRGREMSRAMPDPSPPDPTAWVWVPPAFAPPPLQGALP